MENSVLAMKVSMAHLMIMIEGRLDLSTKHLSFFIPKTSKVTTDDEVRDRKWPLQDLDKLFLRRHLHRPVGIELFFHDRVILLVRRGKRKKGLA